MSGDEGAAGGAAKGGRDLRHKGRKDYAAMHKGVEVHPSMTEDELDELDSLVTAESELNTTDSEVTELSLSIVKNTGVTPKAVASGSKNPDDEVLKLEQRMKKLEEEEKELLKNQKLQQLRKAVSEKEKAVKKLKGRTPSKDISHAGKMKQTKPKSSKKLSKNTEPISNDESDSEINIKSLRSNIALKKMVKKELCNLGLQSQNTTEDSSTDSLDSSSSESSNNESSSSSASSKSKKHKKKKKHMKKKSGIKSKASDKVKLPQKWPHAHLQFEFVNKQVTFEQLDFKMFIVGELEIISGDKISKTEKAGRLELLKKIIYYSNAYEFKGLKAFYAAWLREIELGKKSWTDDSGHIEAAILSKHLRSQKGTTSNAGSASSKKDYSKASETEKVWFCSQYQRNKCPHKSGHLISSRGTKGQMRWAQHICATCWQKDSVKLEHPECSTSCPHASS